MRVKDNFLVSLLDTNDKPCILLAMMLLTNLDFVVKRELKGNREYQAQKVGKTLELNITMASSQNCNWWICRKVKNHYNLDIPDYYPFV